MNTYQGEMYGYVHYHVIHPCNSRFMMRCYPLNLETNNQKWPLNQPVFTRSKSTLETLKGVKCLQNSQ